MIFASSYVYGIPQNTTARDDEAKPNNPYSLSKHFSEELGRFYSLYEDTDFTALRIFNVFGANQDDRFLIPNIIKQIKQ